MSLLHKLLTSISQPSFLGQSKFPAAVLKRRLASTVVQLDDVEGVSANVQRDGDIFELRTPRGRLEGLAVLNAYESTLSCIHLTAFHHSDDFLPTIDKQFFEQSLARSIGDRKMVLDSSNGGTNCCRIVHGASDLLPSLFVDQYSPSFGCITCTSAFSERLLPIAAEVLRDRGCEELIVRSPSIPCKKIPLASPTVRMDDFYEEEHVQFLWHPRSADASVDDRSLLNLGFRKARRAVRGMCRDKKVLCVNDRAGGMTLNACLSAKRVSIVEPSGTALERVLETVRFNHGPELLNSNTILPFESVGAATMDQSIPCFDVITLEIRHESSMDLEILSSLPRLVASLSPGGLLVLQEEPLLPLSGANGESSAQSHVSVPRMLAIAALEAGRNMQCVGLLSPSIDFPTDMTRQSPLSTAIFTVR